MSLNFYCQSAKEGEVHCITQCDTCKPKNLANNEVEYWKNIIRKELIADYEKEISELKAKLNTCVFINVDEAAEIKKLLLKIVNWELPATGQFWDIDEQRPMGYESAYGSNGARDYIKCVAEKTMHLFEHYTSQLNRNEK